MSIANYQNLGQFLEKYSKEHKNRVAFEIKRGFRTQGFTFQEVHLLALKTATLLRQKGLTKRDKVAIWSGNCPEYPILYFGCWILGVIAVPIDVRTTEETVKIFLEKAKCKIGFRGKFIPGSFRGLVRESFCLEDLADLVKNLPEHTPRRSPSATFEMEPQVEPHDLAEIAFTSGTTGTPKGVMLTHGNFLSDVEALTKAFPFKKEYRTLSLLPLSHAFEQVVDFLVTFKSGIKVTYLERTNRLTILKAMKKGQITSIALVPQALKLLMNGIEQEVEKQGKQKAWRMLNNIAPKLPLWVRRLLFREVHKKFGRSLVFFGCGSAPLSVKLAQKWENLGIKVFEGYGATETTAALTINTPSFRRLGSVGRLLPRMEVRINQETHEIEVRGKAVSPGYFEDEKKTKEAFVVYPDKGGTWYKTGDIGEFDSDGFLYITGREDFRIVLPNGQKVYPEDIEKKLNLHPKVAESCVVGVRREEGEVVHAAIITRSPKELGTIIRDVNSKLASHEQILEWSYWEADDFPRTPILKIDRRRVFKTIQGKAQETPTVIIRTEDKLISLISQITKVPPSEIKESSSLATNLKIDSLGRVELLSLIEQEFAVAISETKINPGTTVSKLRDLVKESPTTIEEIPINEFMYSSFMMKLRAYFLQNIFFRPLHSLFTPMDVKGQENLRNISFPAIFYFNHIGIFDAVCLMRILPNSIREKLVVMVNADIWKDYRKRWVEVFAGGFPFDKVEKVKASLELAGDFLDRGFSLIVAPEGTFTKDGKLLAFKPGIGLMSVEMGVSVVPVKIDPSYREIFPPMDGKFIENFPKKRKKIWVKIGKPLAFDRDTYYEEASKKMQKALEEL